MVQLISNSYPLFLGTWILRSTNDNSIPNGLSYLIIDNKTIKFKSHKQEGVFGNKLSKTGIITNITNFDNIDNFNNFDNFDNFDNIDNFNNFNNFDNFDNIDNIDKINYLINIKYSQTTKYSYSFIGIEVPEFQSEKKIYNTNKKFKIKFFDKSILVKDIYTPLYYLFDLQIGNIQKPYIETGLNTFIFTQLISFILNLILAKLIQNLINIYTFGH